MKQLSLLVFLCLSMLVKGQTITGIVKDSASSQVIPFVNVYVPNTSIGTVTDEDGRFEVKVPSEEISLQFSIITHQTKSITYFLKQDTSIVVFLAEGNIEMDAITVEAGKTRIGNRVMRQVLENKDKILSDQSVYSNTNYIKTEMERFRPASEPEDSIVVEEGYDIVYLSEVASRQHFKDGKYKAEILGELKNTSDDKLKRRARLDIDRGFRGSEQGIEYNPIEFFRNPEEGNIELYEASISNATLADRPITSPISASAFVNYRFRLKGINVINGDSIFRISVQPIFKKAPLFSGELVVNGGDWVLESAELSLSNNVITAFKDFTFQVTYEELNPGIYKAVDRNFSYAANIGKEKYLVHTQVIDSDFELNPDFPPNFFGKEIIKYSENALARDTAIWSELRPRSIQIDADERSFIVEQDSIWNYEHSEEYYMSQDSDYNKITFLDVLWSGVNYRNRARGLTLYFQSIAQSVRPLGVGGYRQALGGNIEKEFPSSNDIRLTYNLDYGFNNQDIKGSLRLGYTYLPRRFGRVFASVGDTYDLITVYESLQNIISRGNYIRNQRFSVGHVLEVVNGLYATGEIKYADKRSIEDINLAGWTDFVFGEANAPAAFERYRSFIFELDLIYKFGQEYITRGRKKIVLGNNYPTLNLKYNKGFPGVGGSEVDFDYVELRLSQEMPLTKFGNTNWLLLGGSFLNTRSLRFIEYKYFRGSTPYLFADPLRDYQLLGPTLSTNKTYLQAMAIHHFNGFIMDKIPLINYLQLEVIAGAAALSIPDQNFLHAEMYVGLGRKFKILGEQLQAAVYAATRDNSLEQASISWKFGINVYNAFTGKWAY